jgi:hypothetical protein
MRIVFAYRFFSLRCFLKNRALVVWHFRISRAILLPFPLVLFNCNTMTLINALRWSHTFSTIKCVMNVKDSDAAASSLRSSVLMSLACRYVQPNFYYGDRKFVALFLTMKNWLHIFFLNPKKYYCEHCWATIHSRPGREYHKPLVKEGADRPRAVPFRWC